MASIKAAVLEAATDDRESAINSRTTLAIGAGGAIGILCATALGIGTHGRLVLVCRPHQMAAIESEGVSRSGLLGEISLPPHRFELSDSIDAVPKGDVVDRAILFVKCFDMQVVAEQLARRRDLIGRNTAIFCFQNGLGSHHPLLAAVRPEQIFHARVMTGVKRTAPNHALVTAHEAPILLGSLFPGAPLDPAHELASDLTLGRAPAEMRKDIEPILWQKLTFNAAVNGLCAIFDTTIGGLVDDPKTRPQLDRLLAEIFRISARGKRQMGFETFEAWRDHFYHQLVPLTRDHPPSMTADLQRDIPRPRTEIDFINGVLVELARVCGEPAPENEWVVRRIHGMENERRLAKLPGREASIQAKRDAVKKGSA